MKSVHHCLNTLSSTFYQYFQNPEILQFQHRLDTKTMMSSRSLQQLLVQEPLWLAQLCQRERRPWCHGSNGREGTSAFCIDFHQVPYTKNDSGIEVWYQGNCLVLVLNQIHSNTPVRHLPLPIRPQTIKPLLMSACWIRTGSEWLFLTPATPLSKRKPRRW